MRFQTIVLAAIAGAVTLFPPGVSCAQEQEPGAFASPQAALGTAFTYQGRLQTSDEPVNGTCDFRFYLYDSLAGSGQVGTENLRTAQVTDGLFTIPDLDFGVAAFDGNARWLRTDVRCPAGSGGYATLAPRQSIAPTPYSLHASRAGGLRILESAGATYHGTFAVGDLAADQTYTFTTGGTVWTSGSDGEGTELDADLLDGKHGDHFRDASNLAAGVLATDRYSAYADLGAEGYLDGSSGGDLLTFAQSDGRYWMVGGNAPLADAVLGTTTSTALDLRAGNARVLRLEPNATSPNLVGGFGGNQVTAGVVGAAIGGGGASGTTNRVTDDYGTVGGGRGNRAGNDMGSTSVAVAATVSGGQENVAKEELATVGGGGQNAANGTKSTVAGGLENVAGGTAATIGGGQRNTSSGSGSTIGGGAENIASNVYSTVPGGNSANASRFGQMAFASGAFSTTGDAQASLFVMRREVTTVAGTWYKLYSNGSFSPLTIAPGCTVAFSVLVAGRTEAGESAAYQVAGAIENVGGTTAFVGGTPAVTVLGEDDAAWSMRVVASNSDDSLHVEVQGNGETIRWVATVRTSEVAW